MKKLLLALVAAVSVSAVGNVFAGCGESECHREKPCDMVCTREETVTVEKTRRPDREVVRSCPTGWNVRGGEADTNGSHKNGKKGYNKKSRNGSTKARSSMKKSNVNANDSEAGA